MFVNRRKVRIEWGDCDAAGIVFYPRYFAYFDAATQGYFEAAGFPLHVTRKLFDMVGYPMVDTRAKFILPSSFGEDIEIVTTAVAIRNSSFDVEHKVYKDGLLAIEGFETRVWVGNHPDRPDAIKAKSIPAEVIERLSRS